MRKLLPLALACVVVVATASAADQAVNAVLKQVPDKAGVVVVVPNLDKAVAGLREFVKAFAPEDADEITTDEMFAELPGGGPGFDKGGPLVAAMLPEGSEPLLILRLSDAKAWKEAASPEEMEGGLLKIDADWSTWYAVVKGDVIVLAQDEELAKAAATATGRAADMVAKHAGKALETYSFVIVAETAPWRDILDQGLAMGQGLISMGMMQAGGSATPMSMAMVAFGIEKLREFTTEVEVTVLGAQASAAGIQAHLAFGLVADGKLAKHLAAIEKPKANLLRGIPDVPVMAAFSYEWKVPATAKSLLDQMWERMKAAAPGGEADAAALKALDYMMEMNRTLSGANGVVFAGDTGHMTVLGQYLTSEPAGVRKALRAMWEPDVMSAYMGMWGGPVKMDVTTAQETVGGVETDVCVMKFDTEDPQAAAALSMMYGPTTTFYTFESKHGLGYVMGDKDGARQYIEPLAGGAGAGLPGSAAVKAALAGLPAQPQFVGLIDPVRAMKFAMGMAGAAGAEVPSQPLPDTPPAFAAMTMNLDADAIRIDMVVPTAAVKPLVDYFEAVEQPADEAVDSEPMDDEPVEE
jgi:hypothetical protein